MNNIPCGVTNKMLESATFVYVNQNKTKVIVKKKMHLRLEVYFVRLQYFLFQFLFDSHFTNKYS